MAYLNLDPDYFGHPKIKRLTGLLGKGAAIYPLKLWCYCAKYSPADGRLNGYSAEEIEGIVDWEGKKGDLIKAFLKCRLLHRKRTSFEIHDWLDHEGHIVKFKERSKLAAKKRWDKIITPSNATSNAKNEPKQCPLPTLPTLPNQALPKPIKAQGEKRPAVDNQLKTDLDKVFKDGFNIYSLINKVKKESNSGAEIPDVVLKRICLRYWEDKPKIKEPWPWFVAVVGREWRLAEHEEIKRVPMAQSIKDVLGIK